ncbi:hypothetical protein [Undibacterium sp.]|uniref:hypothetical protein n=1 Tax=Undibacterium sp. TaxID=1914977 RepID=UPI0037522839
MAVDLTTQELLGVFEAERMAPYTNAHLLEEASEGKYSPITDPVFLIYIFSIGIAVFGGGSLFAWWGVAKQQFAIASVPSVIGVSFIVLPLRFVWNDGYPQQMQIALFLELFVYALCAILGILIATRHGKLLHKNGG